MAATFQDKWRNDGMVYNYVASYTETKVGAQEIIDFGVADAKGRAVGMKRYLRHEVRTLHENKPDRGCSLWLVGAPLEQFVGYAISTRNGERFGSAEIKVSGATEAEVSAEIDARIEKARKLAVKKHLAA